MINCIFFITRLDNTHNLKAYKKAFKSLDQNDDNYINIHIKPNTMMLQFEVYCNSFNFYLDLLKSLLSLNINDEIWAVFNTLFSFINTASLQNTTTIAGKRKVHFNGGTITIVEEDYNTDTSWVFHSIDVSTTIIPNTHIKHIQLANHSSTECIEPTLFEKHLQSVYYDYDEVKFKVSGDLDILDLQTLVQLAIMYNSGVISNNAIIKMGDDEKQLMIEVSAHQAIPQQRILKYADMPTLNSAT